MQLIHGDCLIEMPKLAENSVDAIVTDPPYGLSFMGKNWDHGVPGVPFWVEALRVAKPGAMLLAFGGTRTFHRLAVAIEDAGWEIRDTIMWVYSQGFPKGHNTAWKLHEKACSVCGVMVEYDHDNQPEAGIIPETKHYMRFVRATYLQTQVYACAKCGQVLQPFLSEQNIQKDRSAWEKSKNVWFKQSGMEGWDHLEASEGKLQRCEVCQMSHGIFADGAEGWLHYGSSSGNGTIPWQIPNEDGSRTSYRPQSIQQLIRQPDAFRIEQRAQEFRGYNVALKPSWEPILVAMKPPEGTYAENALKWGVAGINVDGCRIETTDTIEQSGELEDMARSAIHSGYDRPNATMFRTGKPVERSGPSNPQGRWPANLIHDGSEEVIELFPQTASGTMKSGQQRKASKGKGGYHDHFPDEATLEDTYGDAGSAARFFYCAKASRAEREMGLEELPVSHRTSRPLSDNTEDRTIQERLHGRLARNHHPTIKPLALMQYLVRLVKPPQGGVILDPYVGSGTTGMACVSERVDFIGIDTDAEYIEIARRRIAAVPVTLL